MYITRIAIAMMASSVLCGSLLAPPVVLADEKPVSEMQAAVKEATHGAVPAVPGEHQVRDPAAIYVQAGAGKEQENQIRTLAKDYETKSLDQSREVVDLLRSMHKLSLQPDLDEEKILATQEQINKLQANMALEKVKLLISIRKILTPEQRKNLVQLMRKRSLAGHMTHPETVR